MKTPQTIFCALIALFIATLSFGQPTGPLNGSYTIGTNSFPANDFETIGAACEYVNTNGVSGPVWFAIMPGVYTDPIDLHSVQGTSTTNTITFQPAGDSLAVTIKSTAFDTDLVRYGARIDHTSNVIIRNLNFAGAAYGTMVVMENGSSNIKILFNNLYGTDPTSGYDGYNSEVGVSIRGSQQPSNIIVRGNNINGFATGIFVSVQSLLLDSEISRNHIDKFSTTGIYFQGTSSNCRVVDNRINANMPAFGPNPVVPSGYGAQIAGTFNTFEFSGNEIKGNFMYGVMLQYIGSKHSPNSYITNNMIAGGSETLIGLAVDYSYNVHVYYNSVQIGSDGPVTYATEFTQDSMMWVLNNIFVANKGVPVTVDQRLFGQNFETYFDFNNYYNHGDVLMQGPDYPASVATLADWQQKTGWDLHSLNIDPEFVGADDLHTRNPLLDALAADVAYPTDDIDKEERAEFPDIGADETFLVAADAGVQEIFTNDLCSKTSDVHVKVRNHSFNNLTGVTIKWSVNGVAQTPKSWTGNLAKGQISDLISAGSFNFVANTSYTIVVQTENPNGTADLYTVNDAKTSSNVFTSISGTYTIGQGGHFATIKQATDLLSSRGVCGPTTFNIKDGTYDERLVLNRVPGTGPDSRIVFQSLSRDKSKVTITYSGAEQGQDYVLEMDSIGFITLRDLSIKTSNAFSTAILFQDVIQKVMIDNCYFYSPNTNRNSLLRSDMAYFSGITIKNSKLEGGDANVRLDSTYPIPSSLTAGLDSVYSNEFVDFRSIGLYLNSYFRVYVDGNKVSSSIQNTFSTGMIINNEGGGQIINNKVQAISNGIDVGGCNNTIANNFITVAESSTSNGPSIGLTTPLCVQTSVLYNSILIRNKQSSSMGLSIGNESELSGTVRNNIVMIDGPGVPVKLSGPIVNHFVCDNNDLLTKGDVMVLKDANSYATLVDWTTATHYDSHSISRDPNFVSASDLHIQNKYLTGRGAPVSISSDIDGEYRHPLYPTIGADEFGVPVLYDIAVSSIDDSFICDNTKPLRVTFINNGILPITSFKFNLNVNGVDQPMNSPGIESLEPEQEIPFTLSSFQTGVAYDIEIVDMKMEVSEIDDEDPTNNNLPMSFTLHKPVDLGPASIGTCSGSEVVLDAGAGYDIYQWSTSAETQTINVDEADDYSVTVKDENGCASSDHITLIVYLTDPVVASSDGNLVVCDGHPVTLTASPFSENAQITWYLDDDVVANDGETFSPSAAGHYSIRMELDGCDFISNDVLVKKGEAPAKPTIDGRPDVCEGEVAILSGPIEATAWIWSTSETTMSIHVSTATTVTLNVKNTDGCISPVSDPVATTIYTLPKIPVIVVNGGTEFCSGSSATLTASSSFGYSWSNSSTGQTISVTEAGTYSVRAFDSNGCFSPPSVEVTIKVDPLPIAEITVDNDKLTSSEGESYKWTYNDTEDLTQSTRTIHPTKSGNYKVTVFAGNCSATSDNVAYIVNGLFDSGKWKVYPNPASSKMTITGSDVSNVKVTMEDAVGRSFIPRMITISSEGISIDVAELSPGVYLLKVDKGNEIIRGKVIVTR
ncbi:MAG: right-handed parallel beta-helix repeat-containing protein [Bacteroidota bacterium]